MDALLRRNPDALSWVHDCLFFLLPLPCLWFHHAHLKGLSRGAPGRIMHLHLPRLHDWSVARRIGRAWVQPVELALSASGGSHSGSHQVVVVPGSR